MRPGRWTTTMASLLAVASLQAGTALPAAASDTGAAGAGDAPWSYAGLDGVLRAHVADDGSVDYPGLLTDRAALDRYVARMARTSPDNRPQLFPADPDRLAYWINAYNALMLHRVVEAWPIDSVRRIRALYGVFWREDHIVGGHEYTLRQLENDVLRARFDEPRIHFAINCASRSCPALRPAAWTPATLDRDLERAAERFIRSPRGVRVDAGAGVVHLSKIFTWYDEDFTGWMDRRDQPHPHGVLDYVARFLPQGAWGGRALGEYDVEYDDYDWSINARQSDATFAVGAEPVGEDDVEPLVCDGESADPWLAEWRQRYLGSGELAAFAVARFGPIDACRSRMTDTFDGSKFGEMRFMLRNGAVLEIATYPPETSREALSVAEGFPDPDAVRSAVADHAERIGLDIDWSTAETTRQGERRTLTYASPDVGSNAQVTLTYADDRLVEIALTMAL